MKKHGTLYCYQKQKCRCVRCRAANARSHREYRARNPEKLRSMNLRYFYGISSAQYEQMLRRQRGVCAACRQPEVARNQFGKVRLAVDHCHETGKIRGLLCMACNRAAGLLKHNPQRLRALARFLENSL